MQKQATFGWRGKRGTQMLSGFRECATQSSSDAIGGLFQPLLAALRFDQPLLRREIPPEPAQR